MAGAGECVELEVCTDCVTTLANGLPEDLDPARAEAISTGLARWADEGWRLEAGTDDAGFSWAHCDLCRDGRGGERHQAWAIQAPQRTEHTMTALVYDDAAWWLGNDQALMVAPIDPATGTADWAQAHRADPMDHPDPTMVLTIADQLQATARGRTAARLDEVINTTTIHPGYLVRDPQGRDLARYDRLDLATAAATTAGGTMHAWGQIGAGPVGWHQITLTPTPGRTTPAAGTQTGAPAPVGAGIGAPRRAVAR